MSKFTNIRGQIYSGGDFDIWGQIEICAVINVSDPILDQVRDQMWDRVKDILELYLDLKQEVLSLKKYG